MIDKQDVFTQVNKLTSKASAREGRYVRNIGRYLYNGNRRVDLWNPDIGAQWYVRPARGGTDGIQTSINVIRSCIDTLVSKMSQATVRPVFNTIDGDFDSRSIARDLQHHFDIYFDEQHADPKLSKCFRDACIFDFGVMYMDPETQSMERVAPYKYFIDSAEYDAGAITQVVKWEKYAPLAKYKDRIDNAKLKARLEDDPQLQGKLFEYWDLYRGYKHEMFDDEPLHDPVKIDTEFYGGLYRRPFVEIWYNPPIKGFYSVSLADQLYEIQRNIDSLMSRIDNATRSAIIAMGFVPEGKLKPSMIENGYKLYPIGPDDKEPKFVVPPVIDGAFLEHLRFNIEQAYELSGISQLSATSQKPADVSSGKAFQTLQDIESDRFNIQLQQYSHFKIDCARVAIDCFPKSKPILDKIMGEKLTWGDARDERKRYTLQFAPADMLSKDPSEKFEQIKMLKEINAIDDDAVADFLQIPDFEGAETSATASRKHVNKIIDRAVKKGIIDFDETVDFQMLYRETIKQLNIMNASGDEKQYIDRCKELLLKIDGQIKAIAGYMQPPPAPVPFEPLREYSLDAGQIQQLSDLVSKVTAQEIPFANAVALATAACPKIPQELIAQMLQESQPAQQPGPQLMPQGATNAA